MTSNSCLVDSSFTNKSVGAATSVPNWLNETKLASDNVVQFENNRGIVSDMHSIADYIISPDRIEEEFRKTLNTTWYIKNILPTDAKFVVIFGEPKTCKSFIVLDMALSIATGIDYHGYKTKQANVLYVAAEGQAGITKRIIGWMKDREIQPLVGFSLYPKPIILDNALEAQELIDYIRSPDSDKPEIIVIDTLARCINGDENNEGMQALVANVTKIIAETGVVVIMIHHTPKSGRQMRGHGCLNGAVDLSYLLERPVQNEKNSEGMIINLSSASVKDHADNIKFSYYMKIVDTKGLDNDNNQVTTLVPELLSDNLIDSGKAFRKAKKVSNKQKDCYFYLKAAIRNSSRKEMGVTKEEWHKTWNEANETPNNFYRNIEPLIDAGYVKENNGLYYVHMEMN